MSAITNSLCRWLVTAASHCQLTNQWRTDGRTECLRVAIRSQRVGPDLWQHCWHTSTALRRSPSTDSPTTNHDTHTTVINNCYKQPTIQHTHTTVLTDRHHTTTVIFHVQLGWLVSLCTIPSGPVWHSFTTDSTEASELVSLCTIPSGPVWHSFTTDSAEASELVCQSGKSVYPVCRWCVAVAIILAVSVE